MRGLFSGHSCESIYKNWYEEEQVKRYNAEMRAETAEKELLFLKKAMESDTGNANKEYERARKYLLDCISFKDGNLSHIIVDFSALCECFDIPFYDLCKQYKDDGTRLYCDVSCILRLERPELMFTGEEVNIHDCINEDLLKKLKDEK